MPRNRVEKPPKSRQRAILEAALSVFEERGYAAATVEDIRGRCGASIGSIYHHFGSKAGIAAALYLEGLAAYQQPLLAQLRRARTARALVRAAVRQHLQWAAANPAWASYLLFMRRVDAVAAVELGIRERNSAFLADLLEIFRPYVEAREIRRLPAPVLLAEILGPAEALLRLHSSGALGSEPLAAVELLADAAWRAVAGEKPATKTRRRKR